MIDLVVGEPEFREVQNYLDYPKVECCAVLFAKQAAAGGRTRLLVRDVLFPTADDYLAQGPLEAVLRPSFVAAAVKRARTSRESLVFVHSHLGTAQPDFSAIDDKGERELAALLAHRVPDVPHVALVMSRGGACARVLGGAEPVRVLSIGSYRRVLFDPKPGVRGLSEVFDRQVRAFGAAGQRTIGCMRIGIVGLGGAGSIVAQQLAYLGVRDFVLIDHDVIEATNLNRVVNAAPTDLRAHKANVAARGIKLAAPDAKVRSVVGDITRARFAQELIDVDFLFGCTDSHGSRAVLQQIAFQYLIPCIDMGVTITVSGQEVSGIFGRIQTLAPGHACLTCSNLLDPNEIRRDMSSEAERKLDPYIPGSVEPAPSVISLNGTVASLAITMFMASVAGVPSAARHVLYNGKASTLRTVRVEPQVNCYVCSRSGTYARGDSQALFARLD